MKICAKCNKTYEDDKKFCKACGGALRQDKVSAPDVLAKRHVLEAKIAKDPGNVTLLEEYGTYLASIELHDEALMHLFQILELEPEKNAVRKKIAKIYKAQREFDKAITQLLILINEQPQNIDLLEDLAAIYLAQEAPRKTEEVYAKLSAMNPDRIDFLLKRLELLRGLGDEAAINDVVNKIDGLTPGKYPICNLYRGISLHEAAMKTNDPALFKKAEDLLAKALKDHKELTDGEIDRGELYLSSVRLRISNAPLSLEKILKAIPVINLTEYDRQVLEDYSLGETNFGAKNLNEKDRKLLSDCFLLLGNHQNAVGLEEDAIDSYKASCNVQGNQAARDLIGKIYEKRGDALYDKGKYSRAAAEYKKGLSHQSHSQELKTKHQQAEVKQRLRIATIGMLAGGAIFVAAAVVICLMYYGRGSSDVSSNLPAKIASPSPNQQPSKVSIAPPAGSNSDKRIQTPSLFVGDEFVMEHNNLANPKLSYVAERKIISIDEDRMKVTSRNLKSSYVRTLTYDLQWNILSSRTPSGDGLDYEPAVKYYDFPLFPGKTWSCNSTERNIKTGQVREHRLSAEVGDYETITVPAGTFQAIRVTIRNEVKDIQTGQVTSGMDVSWYAPAVKRSIKSEMTTFNAQEGRDEVQIAQLLSYSVK